jgi:hypothetical protein
MTAVLIPITRPARQALLFGGPAEPTHHPRHACTAFDPERIADRHHGLADGQATGVAERRDRQALALDLEDREIGEGITAHERGPERPLGAEPDLDLLDAGDDVVVGQDVAPGVDDDPRAQPRGDHRLVELVALDLPRRDAHHRRQHPGNHCRDPTPAFRVRESIGAHDRQDGHGNHHDHACPDHPRPPHGLPSPCSADYAIEANGLSAVSRGHESPPPPVVTAAMAPD